MSDLPCPFCGGDDLTLDNITDGDVVGRMEHWFLSCESCGAQGPVVTRTTILTEAEVAERAATYWNARRTTETAS